MRSPPARGVSPGRAGKTAAGGGPEPGGGHPCGRALVRVGSARGPVRRGPAPWLQEAGQAKGMRGRRAADRGRWHWLGEAGGRRAREGAAAGACESGAGVCGGGERCAGATRLRGSTAGVRRPLPHQHDAPATKAGNLPSLLLPSTQPAWTAKHQLWRPLDEPRSTPVGQAGIPSFAARPRPTLPTCCPAGRPARGGAGRK